MAEIGLRGLERIAGISAELHRAGVEARPKAASIVTRHVTMMNSRVQANANGRPGPNRVTGDYQRSWETLFAFTDNVFAGTSSSNAPQAWRLERGFVGADSLGRHYNQPPFPHAGPAYDATTPEFEKDVAGILDDV